MTTILTTCKGRLDFLKKSLATWRAMTPFNVLVVDYDCPDGTDDWVQSLGISRVRSIPMRGQGGLFNKSRALNCGFTWLAIARETRALLLDADTLITDKLSEDTFCDDTFCLWIDSTAQPELTGAIACDVHAAGRCKFDETFVGYGAEDLDFRLRLYIQEEAQVRFFPHGSLTPQPHGDDLRARYYDEKDLQKSGAENLERLRKKILRPGYLKSGSDPSADPMIRVLLGEHQ